MRRSIRLLRLSPADVFETSQILLPSSIALSPAIGLLATSSNSFISNLRKCKSIGSSCELVNEFYFQREKSGRRFGTLQVSKSKSKPCNWLTTKQLGHILGLSLSQKCLDGELKSNDIDLILNNMGITCNRSNGQFTGISLARYRNIIKLLKDDFNNCNNILNYLSIPIYMRLVWEKAESKLCLLEFLLAVEESSNKQIISNKYSYLRSENSLLKNQWLNSQMNESHLNQESVDKSLDCILLSFQENNKILPLDNTTINLNDSCNSNLSKSLEIVACCLSLTHTLKPAISLSRYSYKDGDSKPDCVEVVLREIIDYLIFDSSKGKLCVDYLPETTLPSVIDFYRRIEAGEYIDDSGSLTSITAIDTTDKIIKAGKVWFDICSQLYGCEYLSVCSDGTPYELKPTLRNVSKAIGILLNNCTDWNSLKLLSNVIYNNNQSTLLNSIEVNECIRSHRAAFSDSEMIHREIIEVNLLHSNVIISIELESAHRMATVKHLPKNNNNKAKIKYDKYLNKWNEICQNNNGDLFLNNPIVLSLYPLLLGEHLLKNLNNNNNNNNNNNETVKNNILTFSLLSTPWSDDRLAYYRNDSADGDGIHVAISVSDGAMSNAALESSSKSNIKAFITALNLLSKIIPKSNINDLNNKITTEELIIIKNLIWILNEVPINLSKSILADSLNSFPIRILKDKDINTILISMLGNEITYKLSNGSYKNSFLYNIKKLKFFHN